MKHIEQQLMKCKECGKKTVHVRNSDKTGFVMILVHLALIVLTGGFWLLLLAIYHLCKSKNKWECSHCMEGVQGGVIEVKV